MLSLESVEQFTKSNGNLDATTQSILDINIVYMSVQVANYNEGAAEGDDNFDAILKSISELVRKTKLLLYEDMTDLFILISIM